jgi:1-acyl-sn-glycerol-3-phosphate acyltransferase
MSQTPPRPGGQGERRPSALRSANLAVRLLCELGLLVALAVWGFHTGSGAVAKVALGLGAPLLAAVIWGLWVAPPSRRRLADPARLVVEALLFAAGVAALAAAGYLLVAVIFAVVVAANIILVRMLE